MIRTLTWSAGVLLVLLTLNNASFGLAGSPAESAETNSELAAVEELTSYVQEVSPNGIKDITDGKALVMLALYVPDLPKWRNHMAPVLETVAEHYADNSGVIVARADAKLHRSLVKKYALRAFPTMVLYPPNLESPSYFHLRYNANFTAIDYVTTIDDMLAVTSGVLDDSLTEVHETVLAFMDSQDRLDQQIAWVGGANRRIKLARSLRKWRRTMLHEDVPEPEVEEDPGVEHAKYAAQDAGLDPNQTVLLTPETVGEWNPESEAEIMAPFKAAVKREIALNNLRKLKLEYYLELLDLIQEYGSGGVARSLNKLSRKLLRDSETLPDSERDRLLMKISILQHFAQRLFE